MELNIEKIKKIKDAMGLTWGEIANITGLKSRQAAFDKLQPERIKSAEFFGRLFNMNPKDLIK